MAAVLIIILDQITKIVIRNSFSLYETMEIIPGIFNLTYIENTGAAFGLLADKRIFFVLMTFAVLAGILYFYRTIPKELRAIRFSLGLVVGGAIGNLIDRILYGSVTDFFDLRIWPVFNIADSAIVLGMLYICWFIIFSGKEIR